MPHIKRYINLLNYHMKNVTALMKYRIIFFAVFLHLTVCCQLHLLTCTHVLFLPLGLITVPP